MIRRSKRISLLLAIALSSTLFMSCTKGQVQSSIVADSVTEEENSNTASAITLVEYSSDDYYTDWSSESVTKITLNNNTADVNGNGVNINNNIITINKAGIYVLSGTLDDGQIVVDTEDKDNVRIVLNGANVNCNSSAPIYVKNAKKTIISLEKGTENTISDTENYTFSDSTTDEPNATIFSKDDLTINGEGKLIVKANYNNGITSKDELRITGGIFQIDSADDGIMGKDYIAIKDGDFTINSSGDGLKSTNDTDTSLGFVQIDGGKYNIISTNDAIQAETSTIINDGEFTIKTGGGSENSSYKSNQGNWGNWGGGHGGNPPMMQPQSMETTTSDTSTSDSAKGIKAVVDIKLNGGTFNLDTSDDSIHSNGDINIAAGTINIASGDDGIHADSDLVIDNGIINISTSYEGIEATNITINGGSIELVAYDDGLNAAGGNDGSSTNGRPGQNQFESTGNASITINGGYLYVDASGDGIDANGSITMTGGTVIVNGPTDSGNGALDYDSTFDISGGTFVAAGSSGMAQGPSSSSTQNSVMMYYSANQEANSLISLQDSKGNSILTFSPSKTYSSVVISSPSIEQGESYTIYSGGSCNGEEKNGLYTSGNYSLGTKVVEFETSNAITNVSESGVISGNQGGFNQGGPGGAQGGERPSKR